MVIAIESVMPDERERHADRVDDREDARLRHVDLFADRRSLCLDAGHQAV